VPSQRRTSRAEKAKTERENIKAVERLASRSNISVVRLGSSASAFVAGP